MHIIATLVFVLLLTMAGLAVIGLTTAPYDPEWAEVDDRDVRIEES